MEKQLNTLALTLTSQMVSAAISAGRIQATDMGSTFRELFAAVSECEGGEAATPPVVREPAVNPRKSIHEDYIICLEDGKKFKSLKRHLSTRYGLTPDEYRTKWGLAPDYPMVAPSYAEQRSHLAKQMGLGRKRAPLGKAA